MSETIAVKIIESMPSPGDQPHKWKALNNAMHITLASWDPRPELELGGTYEINVNYSEQWDQYQIVAKSKIANLGVLPNDLGKAPKVPKRTSEKERVKELEEYGEEPNAETEVVVIEEKEVKQQLSNQLELIVPEQSKLQLTVKNVREYLCPLATDKEIYIFMQICINQGLNPFIKDIYLIKYSQSSPASIVVSKDAFLKKAEQIADYRGLKAGIVILKEDGVIERREGAMKLKDEHLVGGWAKIFRKGMEVFLAEISFEEYFAGKRAKPNLWDKKPSTMIRKVAIVQALREAFPMNFQGMFDRSEVEIEVEK